MSKDDIQQPLLETLELFAKKAADSVNAPVTIKAEIVEELDAGAHKYSVYYGGVTYKDVYALANMSYDPSTIVYVLIPDGDFDSVKFILNAVEPNADVSIGEIEEDNYVLISDNLIGRDNNIEVKLKSWEDSDYSSEPSNFKINIPTINPNFNGLFNNYLDKYKTVLFSARIKTNIDLNHQHTGNYGIKLNLPFIIKDTSSENNETKIEKSFILDVTNMLGDPYCYNEYQTVKLYFDIDDTLKFDSGSTESFISFFTKDFGYSEEEKNNKNKNVDADIYIKDINIQIVDTLLEENREGFYLSLVSDSGNYFISDSSSKKLTPILRANGRITSFNDYECYWFRENGSITINSENYYSVGGIGWECLNTKKDVSVDDTGRKSYQYVTDDYSFIVNSSDVQVATRYKCVLVKNERVVSAIIQLINLKSGIKTYLYSKTGSNTYIENVGNVSLIARIHYPDKPTNVTLSTVWQRFDKDDNYKNNDFYTIVRLNEEVIENDIKYYETEITFPASKIEKFNRITCTFFETKSDKDTKVNKKSIITTNEIVISTSKEEIYTISVANGDRIYKYDSDGDSPMVAQYDGPRSSAITSCDPLTFRIFKPDGTELTETEYKYCNYKWTIPKKSTMILFDSNSSGGTKTSDENYYYVTGKGNQDQIIYKIANIYNKRYSKNTIYLEVFIDDIIVNTVVNIKFLKDGESGTNGSKYNAVIECRLYGVQEDKGWFPYGEVDENGNIRKFQAIYSLASRTSETSGWYRFDIDSKNSIKVFGTPEFRVKVYEDSDRILKKDIDYTVDWSMFDQSNSISMDRCFNINSSTGKLSISTITQGDKEVPIGWDTESTIYCNIVQAKVTTKVNSVTDSEEIIYAYYPIEITRVLALSEENKNKIPTLNGGFEEVTYAADGTNPQYDNTTNFVCEDALYEKKTDLDYEWSWSNNLSGDNDETGASIKIIPSTKYDNATTKNYVRARLKLSKDKERQLKDEIRINTEEKNKKNDERNKNEIIISNIRQVISEITYEAMDSKDEGYKDLLLLCTDILKYRFQAIKLTQELMAELEKNVEYIRKMRIYPILSKFLFVEEPYYKSCQEAIKIAYNYLYLLGNTVNQQEYTIAKLKKLKSDWNIKPISENTSDFFNGGQYIPASIRIILNEYIQTWNELLDKYDKKIDILQEDENVLKQYNKLRNVYYKLRVDSTYIPLVELTFLDQVFVNLQQLLLNFRVEIETPSETLDNTLISYNALDMLFQDIEKAVADFKNGYIVEQRKKDDRPEIYTDYIDIYIKRNEVLTEDIANIDILIKNDQAYLNTMIADSQIIHIKPILMHYNRYELSGINGWDGSKLYTGEDKNNQYFLYAPQVGAGLKHAGTFTGMVMGVKSFNKSETIRESDVNIGLFGYSSGRQSLFLNAKDGSGIFGMSGKGQIIIDPRNVTDPVTGEYGSKALIYSSNYFDLETDYNPGASSIGISDGKPTTSAIQSRLGNSADGMLLNLTDSYIHFGKYQGKIYSSNHKTIDSNNPGFYLSYDGLSIANEYQIQDIEYHDGQGGPVYKKVNGSIHIGTIQFDTSTYVKVINPTGVPREQGWYDEHQDGTYHLTRDSSVSIGKTYYTHPAKDGTGNSPTIYSGSHSTWNNNQEGFYIGQDGISIVSKYRVLDKNGNPIPIEGTNRYKTATGKFAISTSGNPLLYSNNHNNVNARNDGFYLGNDGISIHNFFRVTEMGGLEIGRITGDSSSDINHKWWTINGVVENEITQYSYIGYNATKKGFNTETTIFRTISPGTKRDNDTVVKQYSMNTIVANNDAEITSVYLGTDGFRLGKKAVISDSGDCYFNGRIDTEQGSIGGFTILDNALVTYSIPAGSNEQTATRISEQAYVNGYCKIGSDGEIRYIKNDAWTNNEIYAGWWLRKNGAFSCDMIGSFFGGVNIDKKTLSNGSLGKTTTYNSQAKTPFLGTCADWIDREKKVYYYDSEGNMIPYKVGNAQLYVSNLT